MDTPKSTPRVEVLTIVAIIDDPSRQLHSLADYLIDPDDGLGDPRLTLVSFHGSELDADKGWTDAETAALRAEMETESDR